MANKKKKVWYGFKGGRIGSYKWGSGKEGGCLAEEEEVRILRQVV